MPKMNLILKLGSMAVVAAAMNTSAYALEVRISKDVEYVDVDHKGSIVRIQRIQDQNNHLTGGFAKTSRKCPPFCIQPAKVAPGVTTVGEIEIVEFIKSRVGQDTGVLIDARTPQWHAKGTIPGSTNIPFTVFNLEQNDPKLIDAMEQLGVKVRRNKISGVQSYWAEFKDIIGVEKKPHPYWNYKRAKELLLWCNGMWCGQSPRAIQGLIKHGYPVEKLRYYRGGMTSWQILGLTVVVPSEANL